MYLGIRSGALSVIASQCQIRLAAFQVLFGKSSLSLALRRRSLKTVVLRSLCPHCFLPHPLVVDGFFLDFTLLLNHVFTYALKVTGPAPPLALKFSFLGGKRSG